MGQYSAWKEVFFNRNVSNVYKAAPSGIKLYIRRDESQWQLHLKSQSPGGQIM